MPLEPIKKKVGSDEIVYGDEEVKGNLKASSITIDDVNLQSKVLTTNEAGTITSDASISLEELHALDGATGNIQSQIDDEILARQRGIGQLQSNLDAEASARALADDTLQSNIEDEASIRQRADEGIRDDLSNEISVRTSEITRVEGLVRGEASERQSMDTVLQNLIIDEASTRGDADNHLQSDIEEEISTRTSEIERLDQALSDEADTRETADDDLQTAINDEASARQTSDNTLNARIGQEVIDRQTADDTLQTAIGTEKSRAEGVESQLRTDITNESTVRATADSTLQSNIDAEAGLRASADDTLDQKIEQEISDRQSAIQSEELARDSADIGLQQNIDSVSIELSNHKNDTNNPHVVTKEQVGLDYVQNCPMDSQPSDGSANYVSSGGVYDAIYNAVSNLQSNIDAEASARDSADISLQNAIDSESYARQTLQTDLESHLSDKDNPHEVTASQVGLGSVVDYPMDALPTAGSPNYVSSDGVYDAIESEATARGNADTLIQDNLTSHVNDTNNPHSVTATQVGLGNVDNTSDLDKPISTATQTALNDKAPIYHASQNTTYGVGDATNYGHLKMDVSISGSRTDTTISESGIRAFVNSSIGTSTANFLGTYDAVIDLGFPQATVDTWTNQPDSTLESSVSTAITSAISTTPTNNDYVFVSVNKSTTTDVDFYWRFKFDGTRWLYEYTLNNSSFSQEQWNAINSGLSSSDKTKLDTIQTGAEVNVQADWNVTDNTSDAFIKNKPTIPVIPSIQISGTNAGTVESGKFLSSITASGHTITVTKTSVPSLAKGTTTGSGNVVSDISVSGHTITLTKGVTALTSLAKGTTTGSGNAVTDISISGNTITLTKGTTFLTQHQDISDKMNTDMSNIAIAGTKADGKTVVWDATNTRWMYGDAGKVDNVKVNGSPVVTNRVANITVPTDLGDLTNNAGYVKSSGVTSISTGVGLSGGTITSTGTIKANLNSESSIGTIGSNKVYAVGVDANGKLAVNVPWSDTNTTYSAGDGLTLTGTTFTPNTSFTTSGKNYKVQVDSTTKGLYVNVPWSDTNTTYSAGDGLVLTGTVFTPNTSFTTSGKNYKVQVDSTTKGLYVNVPWSDTNTTYSAGTGLSLSGTSFSLKTGYTTSGKNYAVVTDSNGNPYVNVPWSDTNTTYSAGVGLSLDGTTFSETYPIYYAKPNETTATATLTATISNFPTAYRDGIMIALRMPFNNVATSTLNVNGLGAKNIYYANNTTTATRWAYAGCVALLVYETTTNTGGCWKAVYSYDSNSDTKVRQTTLNGSDATNRSLLLSYAVNTTTGNTDNVTYRSTKIYANDSTGTITATAFVGNLAWSNVTSKPFVSFGNTIAVTNNVADVRLGYTTSGKNYAIAKDSSGNLYVNVPWTDNNTWTAMVGATSSANGSVGYVNAVPPKDGYNTKYLRADGTWAVPPDNNTWTAMVGATSSANGSVGYVNAVPPKDGYNTKYLRADGTWAIPPDNNTTYSAGDGLTLTGTTFTPNTSFTTSGKNYKVQVDSTTKGLYVNVPWTDNNTWQSMTGATSSANGRIGYINAVPPKDGYNTKYWRADGTWAVPPDNNTTYSAGDGLVLTGTTFTPNTSFTTSGKNYKVQVDSTTKGLYVNVPWSDTNTTYSAGTGLTLSSTTFKTKLNSETSLGTIGTTSKLYAVGVDSNGQLAVSVPWTDNNTTYSAGVGLTLSSTTFKAKLKSETASTLDSTSMGTTANRQYAVGVDKSGYLSVNIPWTDHTYTVNNKKIDFKDANGTIAQTFTANQSSDVVLTFEGSGGITVTADATNKKITASHSNSISAGTIGSASASSGATLSVPYANYDANGHITGKGTHTHSVTALVIGGSATNTTMPTASSVQLYKGSINGSASTTVWLIETYLSGNYGFQRATSLADSSEVCIRTRNNSSSWGTTWTYAYASWKA